MLEPLLSLFDPRSFRFISFSGGGHEPAAGTHLRNLLLDVSKLKLRSCCLLRLHLDILIVLNHWDGLKRRRLIYLRTQKRLKHLSYISRIILKVMTQFLPYVFSKYCRQLLQRENCSGSPAIIINVKCISENLSHLPACKESYRRCW